MGKNYAQSDYGVNKANPNAIICTSVTGESIKITSEQFQDEAEFFFWKDFSDEDYHQTELVERPYTDDLLYLDGLSDEVAQSPSAEDIMLALLAAEEFDDLSIRLWNAMKKLTPTQQNRIILYAIEGLSQQDIADRAGGKQQRISKSIAAAKNKLKKILKNRG